MPILLHPKNLIMPFWDWVNILEKKQIIAQSEFLLEILFF